MLSAVRMSNGWNAKLWVVSALLLATASCSSSSDSGGAAGAGGTVSGGAGASGAGGTSAAGSGAVDWSQCGARAPDSTCSQALTCHFADCGKATSRLDENGCLRSECTADSACQSGEVCFPGWVVYTSVVGAANFKRCATSDQSSCTCFGQAIATGPAYCVASALAAASTSCVLDPSIVHDCTKLKAWVAAADSFMATLSLSAGVTQSAQTCLTSAKDQLAQLACAN